jgi:hypothetical protein
MSVGQHIHLPLIPPTYSFKVAVCFYQNRRKYPFKKQEKSSGCELPSTCDTAISLNPLCSPTNWCAHASSVGTFPLHSSSSSLSWLSSDEVWLPQNLCHSTALLLCQIHLTYQCEDV